MAIKQGLLKGTIPPSQLFAEKEDAVPSEKKADTWLTSKYWYGRMVQAFPPLAAIAEHEALKQFPISMTDGRALFALSFTVDAAETLFERYLGLVAANKMPSDYFYFKKAYEDPEEDYLSYIEGTLYPVFEEYLTSNQKLKKVVNFANFEEQFGFFAADYATLLPCTFTSYIASRFYSPLNSGLAIALSINEPADSMADSAVYRSFVKLAEASGFFVDANIPTRIYADIGHPSVAKLISSAGYEKMEYLRPITTDEVSRTSGVLQDLYERFREQYPSHMSYEQCNGSTVVVTQLVAPSPFIGEERSLGLYFYLRAKEYGASMTQGAYEAFRSSILANYRALGLDYALSGIEKIYPIAGKPLKGEPESAMMGLNTKVHGTFFLH